MSSRENARRRTCQTNLKGLATAFSQYIKDYDGRFPVVKTGSNANLPWGWFGNLHLEDWPASVSTYAKESAYFQCPKDETHVGTDYYLNRMAAGVPKSKFANPDRTVLLTEGSGIEQGSMAVAVEPDRTAFRHLDGSNYLFVDGHVKWLQHSRAATHSGVSASAGGFTFGS